MDKIKGTLEERALQFAITAHLGQTDKNGVLYIWHPIRVALRVNGEFCKCAALLHDVKEDTPTTLDDLRDAGFPESVVTAVDYLSRRENETYMDFIRRCRKNEIAKGVKNADLDDNMAPNRASEPGLLLRYTKARALLNEEGPELS